MKSKSPFSKKSPMKLQVYRGDTYESPDTVITKTVGEQVGAAITGLADNAVDYMNTKSKRDPSKTIASVGLGGGEYKGFGGGMKEINLPETPDVNTNLTNPNDFSRFTESNVNKSLTKVPDLVNEGKVERGIKTVNGKKVLTHEANADKLGYKKGTKERTDFINASTEYNKLKYKTDEPTKEGKAKNYATTKGSPNKLIGDTMDPYGQPKRGIRDFTFNENEIAPGTLGSQASMGIQKEIFGGGQAQAAAEQLQTPLYDKGHGVKQAHTHPSKTTTKMSGKGEMPGSSYVKGDYVDEDDLLDVGMQRHIATLAQSDNKGTFIKQKPDTGPESNISTAKGFGEKIRLNNMSRPDYTSNEGDQMDPHDFLFKKTPKNNKKK